MKYKTILSDDLLDESRLNEEGREGYKLISVVRVPMTRRNNLSFYYYVFGKES